eukprot:c17947_g1_i5.p1 GENE.c17947_g1_i5~~c17947_g1_i5.p1  ORF type:complete len:145 (+),score=3.02 c17947_g1_i5:289-723(+)
MLSFIHILSTYYPHISIDRDEYVNTHPSFIPFHSSLPPRRDFSLSLCNTGVAGISTIGTESEHQVREYKFDTAKPFPIINCSIILPNDEYRFHPFEFTPLYCGSISRRSYNGKLLGGCLVEPIGFNSNRPHDLDDLVSGGGGGK